MAKTSEEIAGKLKELIDKNGPTYLVDNPFQVYKELIQSKNADKKTAGAILCFLVSNIAVDIEQISDQTELVKAIQKECGFNKNVSDKLAEIMICLYSPLNKQKWAEKDMEGLVDFLGENFNCTWKGFAVWDTGNGTVDCTYEADIVLKPTTKVSDNKELFLMLKKNPFMTKEEINTYFEKQIRKYLDNEFEKYCTEDDYYQPVVEDFEIDYNVTEWSRKNGFEVISCEGGGEDGGYEPKFRKGWY